MKIEKDIRRCGSIWRGSVMQPTLASSYNLLYMLGLRANTTSFFHLAYAIRLGARQPQRLLLAEWIYPEVANCYDVSVMTVRDGVKKLSIRAWKKAPTELQRLAGEELSEALPPNKFLTVLSSALRADQAA